MLMKDAEQLIAASKVLKEARALQSDAFQKAKAHTLGFNETVWNEENSPLAFVENAYRNLQAVAFKVSAVQAEDQKKGFENMINAAGSPKEI